MSHTKVTPQQIKAMKQRGARIPALTAYDFAMAKILDDLDIPLLLVGDSLGMVVLGYPDTTLVTIEEIEHHLRAVARAKPNALVAADLPYGTYDTPENAVANAQRLIRAGAEAVKAEGGREIQAQIKAIAAAGIPFLGHLGMLPQSIRLEGGYHIKGKIGSEHQALLQDAALLADLGAFAIVLELVLPAVAREITQNIGIPTIGIGSGSDCDGQILVVTDLLGTSPNYIPKHVKRSVDVAGQIRSALTTWRDSVLQTTAPIGNPAAGSSQSQFQVATTETHRPGPAKPN